VIPHDLAPWGALGEGTQRAPRRYERGDTLRERGGRAVYTRTPPDGGMAVQCFSLFASRIGVSRDG
jgi:hypothetical protein